MSNAKLKKEEKPWPDELDKWVRRHARRPHRVKREILVAGVGITGLQEKNEETYHVVSNDRCPVVISKFVVYGHPTLCKD